MVRDVPRRLEYRPQSPERPGSVWRDVLRHHGAAPAARRHRRGRAARHRHRVPSRALHPRPRRNDRLVLALRRPGVDVRVPHGLPHERSLTGAPMTTAPASGPSVRTYLVVWVALLLIVLAEI